MKALFMNGSRIELVSGIRRDFFDIIRNSQLILILNVIDIDIN